MSAQAWINSVRCWIQTKPPRGSSSVSPMSYRLYTLLAISRFISIQRISNCTAWQIDKGGADSGLEEFCTRLRRDRQCGRKILLHVAKIFRDIRRKLGGGAFFDPFRLLTVTLVIRCSQTFMPEDDTATAKNIIRPIRINQPLRKSMEEDWSRRMTGYCFCRCIHHRQSSRYTSPLLLRVIVASSSCRAPEHHPQSPLNETADTCVMERAIPMAVLRRTIAEPQCNMLELDPVRVIGGS